MKMQHREPFATGVSTRHPTWPGVSHQGCVRLSWPSLQMSAVAADVCRLPGQRCCPRGGRWKAPNVPLARASGPLGDGARPGSGAARHRRACSSASRAPPAEPSSSGNSRPVPHAVAFRRQPAHSFPFSLVSSEKGVRFGCSGEGEGPHLLGPPAKPHLSWPRRESAGR